MKEIEGGKDRGSEKGEKEEKEDEKRGREIAGARGEGKKAEVKGCKREREKEEERQR